MTTRLCSSRFHRRGAIFITALGITVVLSGLVLVFAMNMRTESLVSANRLAVARADAIAQGAEHWLLAQVESNSPNATTITQVPAEALSVGDGYFWILHADSESDGSYIFGISDESAKVNLNTANAEHMLITLADKPAAPEATPTITMRCEPSAT